MDKEISKTEEQSGTPLVSIFTLTYNHAPYIRQCLDGFLMQKTDFPFEVIINDDASTDGTTEIVREYESKYPDIIKPIYHSENRYSKGERGFWSRYCLPKSRGKYIALCEGDDYWIDPLKLQKQVDFLEANPEFGMCYTDFNIWYETKRKMDCSLFKNEPQKFPAKYKTLKDWILAAGYVAPMTWVVRRELFLTYPNIISVDGTFALFSHFMNESKVHCLSSETTAVYRKLRESASHSLSLRKRYSRVKGIYSLQQKLAKLYKIDHSDNLFLLKRRYYSNCLRLFVALNARKEIADARSVLKGKETLGQRVLFFICDLRMNKMFYYVYLLYIKCK